MNPTEAALAAGRLFATIAHGDDAHRAWLKAKLEEWFQAEALAAPPHGKDAGEDLKELHRFRTHLKGRHNVCDNPPSSTDLMNVLCDLEGKRDALQDLIHTAADTLDIVAASPQDFVTHVLLLREERDELKARLTEAEGLLREYLRPGRNSPEDLDGDTAAFLRKPPEATP